MKIQVINKSKHALPEYATGQSAGMDIRANLDEPIVLKPLQRCLVPTGLYIALPEGFEAQIRPRSGLAIKKGIGVLNSPGASRLYSYPAHWLHIQPAVPHRLSACSECCAHIRLR